MAPDHDHDSLNRTRATLLKRAALGDEIAWIKLDGLYRPMLLDWARRSGANSLDADEAASEVLVTLVRFLARFEYDPSRSFRGYLRTMLRNELIRLSRMKLDSKDDSQLHNLLADEASKDSLVDLLISQEEQLRIPAVLLAARKRLRKAATWDSWEMTELRGIPAKDVAAKLGIPVANVYVNRQRVAEMIETVGRELIGEP